MPWKLIVYAVGEQRLPRIPDNALYNLKDDPLEVNNLIGRNSAKRAALPKARELATDLEAWMARPANPLLARLRQTEL